MSLSQPLAGLSLALRKRFSLYAEEMEMENMYFCDASMCSENLCLSQGSQGLPGVPGARGKAGPLVSN